MASKSLYVRAVDAFMPGPRARWISTGDSELSISYRDAYVPMKPKIETVERMRMSALFGITCADLQKIYHDAIANRSDL